LNRRRQRGHSDLLQRVSQPGRSRWGGRRSGRARLCAPRARRLPRRAGHLHRADRHRAGSIGSRGRRGDRRARRLDEHLGLGAHRQPRRRRRRVADDHGLDGRGGSLHRRQRPAKHRGAGPVDADRVVERLDLCSNQQPGVERQRHPDVVDGLKRHVVYEHAVSGARDAVSRAGADRSAGDRA